MGKKVRCRKTYASKGQRRNVSRENSFDTWSVADRMLFKVDAMRKGKRVYFTEANPNRKETNKRFIKVCINGK